MKLELTTEEMVEITKMLKVAKVPMKALDYAKTAWWSDDVVEVTWYSGLNYVSLASNGDAYVCVNGMDEKEVKRSTAKRLIALIGKGTDRGIIEGHMVRAKEESDR